MGGHVPEVFFRPSETGRDTSTIPAALFNRCRLLLARCDHAHVFVPIRSMQFLGVIDDEEIIFVDSQAYRTQGEEGGRLILLAWQFRPELRPAALDRPVPIDFVYYHSGARDLQKRLIGEFGKALDLLERRYGGGCEARIKKVLPFRGTAA